MTYQVKPFTTIQSWEHVLHLVHQSPGHSYTTNVLRTDSTIQFEMESLCTELTYDSGKKVVLMILFASVEMSEETMEYPDAFFM